MTRRKVDIEVDLREVPDDTAAELHASMFEGEVYVAGIPSGVVVRTLVHRNRLHGMYAFMLPKPIEDDVVARTVKGFLDHITRAEAPDPS